MGAADKTLLVVDLQNDFVEGGSLAVAGGKRVAKRVGQIAKHYDCVLGTLDWHPPDHVSFNTFVPYNAEEEAIACQVAKWPVHCVRWTRGAFPASGVSDVVHQFFPKGQERLIEEFSAAGAISSQTLSPLVKYLHERKIREIDVCGLALEYCVAATAIDLRSHGFAVRVLMDAVASMAADLEP